jgi:hypothetical protein
LTEDVPDTQSVPPEHGCRIEPQAGENLGAQDAILSRSQFLKSALSRNEPHDLVLSQRHHEVFAHAGALVIVPLGVQVDRFPTRGDLDDKFRRADDIFVFFLGLPAFCRGDQQTGIGLWFALFAEDVRGVIEGLAAGGGLLVFGEPVDDPHVHASMPSFERRRHENDTSDQFGACVFRHRFVAGVEGFLIETIAVFERRQLLLHKG